MTSSFGDRRLGYIWGLLGPVVVVCSLILLFTVRGRQGSALLPLMVFIATGFPIFFAFNNMWTAATATGSSGLMMFPQITQLDIVVSKVLLEFATQTVAFIVICIGFILIADAPIPADPLNLMFAFWSVLWLGIGVGLFNMAVKRVFPVIDFFLTPVKRLGLFISGAIFTAADLPSWALPYFSWNPVFRAIEIARSSWYPSYRSPIYDPMYIIVIAVFVTAVAIIAERATRRYSTQ
jgi:capsular polysaccharide transport system permease protein